MPHSDNTCCQRLQILECGWWGKIASVFFTFASCTLSTSDSTLHVLSFRGDTRGKFCQFNGFRSSCFCLLRNQLVNKNAAKRSRQHAGKKYREYAQRHVCFVNEQVPWPHSNINVKYCTSRVCMKMLSFLFVRAWAMPRILYLSCGIQFPVWTPGIISVLTSVVVWEFVKIISGNLLMWEEGGNKIIGGNIAIIFLKPNRFVPTPNFLLILRLYSF